MGDSDYRSRRPAPVLARRCRAALSPSSCAPLTRHWSNHTLMAMRRANAVVRLAGARDRARPLPACIPRAQPPAAFDPALLPRTALAQHRAVPRRPHEGRRRHSVAAERLLHRRRATAASGRRPTAGRTWTPIFDDQPTGSIGAIAVAPSDPQHHLRRQRRGPAAARSLDRRRHLQVDRRRQDLDAPRPARRPADPADHRRPARIRTGCSSPCSAIRTARTRSAASSARPTAARRWQKVLYKDEDTGGVDLVFDPAERATRSTPCCGRRGKAPWENGVVHGPGQRPLQVDRRRHDVAPAHDGPADVRRRRPRPHRHHRRAQRTRRACSRPSRRRTRGGLYRSDDAGETLAARQRRPARDRARLATSPR